MTQNMKGEMIVKICSKCGARMQDDCQFCAECGAPVNQAPRTATYLYTSSYDHTSEFNSYDISQNKVLAIACYLMGIPGIIIALLGSNQSPYAAFHVRQALKFSITNILLLLIGMIFIWTLILPIACVICYLVLSVIRIICFFSACMGRAKEPAIIRSLPFLQ